MADGFGLDTGGNVVVQQPASSGQGPATRLQGGGGTSFSSFGQASRAPGVDFTGMDSGARALDAINKLTQGALAPLIEAQQKRQYFDGMSQVAQGKALIEVQKEQPWYTQIFGPSATMQGAQAMTLMSAVDGVKSQFIEQMPELRKQTPDVVRKYLSDQAVQVATTGDGNTDALIQAKLAEQWGPMLDLHMKQHIAYVQEQNVTSYSNTLMTTGDQYQKTVGNGSGYYSPEQLQLERDRASQAFAPMPGMTDDAWSKATTQALQANLMQGNFGIYDVFKQSENWNKLPLEARTQLERLQPYATQWVQKNMPMFRQDMTDSVGFEVALSQATGPQSIDALHSYIDQKNKDWMSRTGSTSPYYDNAEAGRLEKLWYTGQEYLKRQQAAAAATSQKAEEQAMDANFQRQTVMQSVNSGAYNPVAMNNLSADIVQQTLVDARTALQSSGDTAGMTKWLNKLAVSAQWGNKMVDHALSDRMTVDANNFFVQGSPITDQMRESLKYMQMMASGPNGLSGLASYVGAENAAKMTALVKSGVDLGDRSAVDAARQAISNGWNADVTKDDVKKVASFLQDEDPGFIRRNLPLLGPGGLSGYNLNDDSKRRMAQDLAPAVARLTRGMNLSREEAMQIAFSQQFGAGSDVDFVDGTYFPASSVSKGGGLFATIAGKVGGMSQLSEDYQTAVHNVINNNMGAAIGKVPLNPSKDLTAVDRAANTVARSMNMLIDAVPVIGEGLPKPFNETGRITPDPTKFDPDDYKTVGGLALGGGVLQVTRLPKTNDRGLRPVTVTITADQVLAEIDAIRRSNVKKKAGWQQSDEDAAAQNANPLFIQ